MEEKSSTVEYYPEVEDCEQKKKTFINDNTHGSHRQTRITECVVLRGEETS